MQAVELRDVKFNPRLRAKLLQAQYLTAAEVLLSPTAVLARRAKLSLDEASQLVRELSAAVCARDAACDHTLSELNEQDAKRGRETTMTSGDAGLDELLGGGLRAGSVTEVAGHSSSGKTHFCLQTALTCQLPSSRQGLAGGALFISSEGTVPSTRLYGLAEYIVTLFPPDLDTPVTGWDLLDNVHAEKAQDVETLEAVLSYHVPAAIERINALAAAGTAPPPTISPFDDPLASQFLSQNRNTPPRPPLPIRLIIVDSIAAPFRAETETGSLGFAERSKQFAQIGDTLKRLANVYDCAVVVVNQVTDVFDSRGSMPPSFLEDVPVEPHQFSPLRPSFASASPLHLHHHQHQNRGRFPTPSAAPLSRSSTSSSTSTSSTNLPPPPHQQHNFPSLLYSRYQSPHFTGDDASSPYRTSSSLSYLLPFAPTAPVSCALGHSWSNIPTTRVLCLLKRSEHGGGRTRRAMCLVFSPYAPRAAVEHEISEEFGVRSVGVVAVRLVGKSAYASKRSESEEADETMQDGVDEEEASLWRAVDGK